jgi:hypothetical protein
MANCPLTRGNAAERTLKLYILPGVNRRKNSYLATFLVALAATVAGVKS